MRTKCIIFNEALRNRVKKFKQSFPENYSKSTKIAIAACKFSKFFSGEHAPGPPRAFFVSQSALNLFCPKKKYTRKKCGNYAPPPPFKISRYATAYKTCLLLKIFTSKLLNDYLG